MRRGYAFEGQIEKLIQAVNAAGFHAHKNHPCRTADGLFLEGEPFDYEIITDTYKATFDAKECRVKNWNLSNAKLSQVNHLKHCKNAGMHAFFLVYFYKEKEYVIFDVDKVIDSLKNNKKSLSKNDGERWCFPNDFRNKTKN